MPPEPWKVHGGIFLLEKKADYTMDPTGVATVDEPVINFFFTGTPQKRQCV
jgi:hypothetical protein